MIEIMQKEIVFNISRQLEMDLTMVKDSLMEIVKLPEFPSMDIPGQQRIIDDYIRFLQPISSLHVINAKGWFVSSSADLSIHTGRSYADQPFFTIPFEQGETYFGSPIFFRTAGFIGTSVNVPIQSDAGKRVGVLTGGMRLTELIAYVTEYPLPEGIVVFLVDREGTVIAHSGIDLFALKEGPLSLNFSEHALAMEGKATESEEYDQEGTRYLGSYATLESSGWGVVAEIPMSLVLAKSNIFAWRLTLVTVIAFAAAFLALLFFARQITLAHKQKEEIIREAERKYRSLFENMPDGFAYCKILLDENNRPIDFVHLEINDAFERLTGLKRENVVGKKVSEAIPGTRESHPELFDIYGKVALTRKETKFDIYFKPLKIWLSISAYSPIKGYFVAVFNNITERKKAEEEGKEMQTQLFQAQKMEAIGVLVSGVAHDFNNLLMAIQGNTELLLGKLEKTDPLCSNLKDIHRASKQGADLIRQLLLFSRKQPMHFRPLNINKTVENLLKMMSRLIGEDISIETRLEPELWVVEADVANIEQMLVNFVINARDAMPEGGTLTIKTENVTLKKDECKVIPGARRGKFVRISLQDTGVGMDEGTVERVFEPFFTTKKNGKGTGLGLSVAYGIAKKHKGWINVETRAGKGSTFKTYLPVSSKELEDESKKIISLTELQGSGERILVVEDQEGVREFLRKAISENGYLAIEAKDAKEARDIFEEEKGNFDLIFCDVVLPDENGIELADQLLSQRPGIPVLLSSGYVDEKSQWLHIRKKGFRFLQKPYDITDLFQTIKEILQPS